MKYQKNPAEIGPDLTPEMMDQIDDIINRYQGMPGALIPVLTECQQITGYLPVELQEYIGYRMDIPYSTIYGVVTFYSFFTMVPKGRHQIKICLGTACYVRGSKEILNRLRSKYHVEVGATTEDRRFSLDAVRCLGACGLAPVMVVDADTHGAVTPESALKIVESYD